MFRIPLKRVAIAAALLAALPSAFAHRVWLLPSSTLLDGKEPWVTFDAAVSEDLFDFGANALKLDGLQITAPDGAKLEPANPHTGRLRSSFDLQLQQSGTYRVSLVTNNVFANYKVGTETKRFRGTEDALKKALPADATELKITRTAGRLDTFVTAGKANAKALQPQGQGLEMQPLGALDELSTTAPAPLRFLLNGKPLAGLTVSVTPGGVRYRGVLLEKTYTTDAKGEVKVAWPQAGMYLVNASYPPRPEVAEGAPPPPMPEQRYTYGATLEVLPE